MSDNFFPKLRISFGPLPAAVEYFNACDQHIVGS